MPLDKTDAPANPKSADDSEPHKITSSEAAKVFDAGAGAPAGLREAAEALPERNDIQKEIKAAMLSTDAQSEAKHKAKVVELSPDSPETPSGAALLASAGVADDRERAEKYGRIKAAVRAGLDPEKDLK